MAVSSELSPRLPKVISDESSMASGNACGMSMSPMYQKNCASTSSESPLPNQLVDIAPQETASSAQNWQMKNVPRNSRPNCLAMNMSNFFMRSIVV